MSNIDHLLEARLRYTKALARESQAGQPEAESFVDMIKVRLTEIDRELIRESACAAAEPDLIAARGAVEKANYTDDYELASRESNFFWSRANYKFLERLYGKDEAKKYISGQSEKIGADLVAHILNGTVPDF